MITRKLGEHDLTMTTLYLLFTNGGSLNTAQLKNEIIETLNPQGDNLDPLQNRADSKITQIVRNIISHRPNRTNIINKGLINYDDLTETLSITNTGIQHLDRFIVNKLIEELE